MKDKFSTYSQAELTRRSLMQGMSAVAGLAALGGAAGRAAAQDMPLVKAYGVPTAALKDWAPMEKSIGVRCELSGASNDVGVFMRDVMGANMGDSVDLFIFESGTEDILGPQGLYAPLDEKHPELTLWERTSDDWKRSAVVQDTEGNQWGVPVIGNADSFGWTMGSSNSGSTVTVDFFDLAGNVVGTQTVNMGADYQNYLLTGLNTYRGLTFYNNNDPSGVRFQNMFYNALDNNGVPEPATLALVAFGLAGAAGLRRRRAA